MSIEQNYEWKSRAIKAFTNAFLALYEQNPINKISVSAVCTKAGYSRSAFYAYYTDIYDFLEALENELLESLGDIYQIPADTDHQHEIKAGVVPSSCKAWFQKCYQNRRFLQALLSEHGDPAFQFKLRSRLRQCLSRMASFDGVQDDDRTKALMEYQVCGVIGVLQYYMENEAHFDAEEASEVVNTIRKRWIMSKRLEGKNG